MLKEISRIYALRIPLGQQIYKAIGVILAYIFDSFENVLLQVEHFYSPLCF